MPKTCLNCGTVNRDDAHFCAGCATPLAPGSACPVCGAANLPGARFCNQCAAPLASSRPLTGQGNGSIPANSLLGGRYVIVQKVGQGGMGAVYKAADMRLSQKIVALKELSEAALTSPLERQQARQAFEQEAQMLATLNHPNLPVVSDHFSENARLFLVMDFINGRTLDEILEQAGGGPLPEHQVLDWADQLCSVLEYLHSRRPSIVFRDLKPANIMIESDDRVRLIDFGIARLFKPGKNSDTSSFGTAGYAPPEQYGKGQTDARSDLYALGATLHQLLTGRDPGETPFQFQPVRSLNPDVSENVERTIMRAVEQDPARRWQNALEMRQSLNGPPPITIHPLQAPYAPTPSTSAAQQSAPARAPAGRFGFWSWLLVAVGLYAIASVIQVLAMSGLAAVDAQLASVLSMSVRMAAAPLLFKLTRRNGSGTLLACLEIAALFIQGTTGEVLANLALMNLATGVTMDLIFGIDHRREPRFWVLAAGPLVGEIAWWATSIALGRGSLAVTSYLIASLVGSILGGAVAWAVGVALGPVLARPRLAWDRAGLAQALCIACAAVAARHLVLGPLVEGPLPDGEDWLGLLTMAVGPALMLPFVAKATHFPGAVLFTGLLALCLQSVSVGGTLTIPWQMVGIACMLELFYLLGAYRFDGFWRTTLAPVIGVIGVWLLFNWLASGAWPPWDLGITLICTGAFSAATVAYVLALGAGR